MWRFHLYGPRGLYRIIDLQAEDAACHVKNVSNTPDLPPMTTGQLYPQYAPDGPMPMFSPRKSIGIFQKFALAFEDLDGLVTAGVPEIEPNATRCLREDIGWKLYLIGTPGLELEGDEVLPEKVTNERYQTDNGSVKKFLDHNLRKNGEKSVVFIRCVLSPGKLLAILEASKNRPQ